MIHIAGRCSCVLALVIVFASRDAAASSVDDPVEASPTAAPTSPTSSAPNDPLDPPTPTVAPTTTAPTTVVPTSPPVATTTAATATTTTSPPTAGAGATSKVLPVRDERFRVNVDLSVGRFFGFGVTENSGTTGALGGLLGPAARVGAEVRMAGPAWFVFAAEGSYWGASAGDASVSTWSGSLLAGPRFEVPVLPHVDVGGHVLFRGTVQTTDGTTGSGPDGVAYGGTTGDVGGVAGGSIHVRPSDFFGIRLVVDVLDGRFSPGSGSPEGSDGRISLGATPWVGLTFTF